MIELSEKKRERLERALTHLKVASIHIGESASGVKPFKASKFLNVLMKEVYQLEVELRAYLKGELPDESQLWSKKQSTFLIMQSLYVDGELELRENK